MSLQLERLCQTAMMPSAVTAAAVLVLLAACTEDGGERNEKRTGTATTTATAEPMLTCPEVEWRMDLAAPEAEPGLSDLQLATRAAAEIGCTALTDIHKLGMPPTVSQARGLPMGANAGRVYVYGLPLKEYSSGEPLIELELAPSAGRLLITLAHGTDNGMRNMVSSSLELLPTNPALRKLEGRAPTPADFAMAIDPQYVEFDSITHSNAATGYGGFITSDGRDGVRISTTYRGREIESNELRSEMKELADALNVVRPVPE